MVLAGVYECKNLESIRQNCIGNPRVRITKATRNYRLALCANNTCMSTVAWIKCKNVCPVCRSLPGQHGKYDGKYINTIYRKDKN